MIAEKRVVMEMGMRMETDMSLALSQMWDDKLVPNNIHPYPLAPRKRTEEGLVTADSYQRENYLLGRFVHFLMFQELLQWLWSASLELLPAWHLEIFGAGLMRDLTWLSSAVTAGFSVSIRDFSQVACENAYNFLISRGLHEKIEVSKTSIELGWRNGLIDDEQTTWYYAGQLVQNQGPDEMWQIMRHFGRFLCQSGNRRVYLLHARAEDNPPEEVTWNYATPWSDEQLFTPLEFDLNHECPGSRPKVEMLGQHKYFNNVTYTLFRIEKA